MKKIISILMTTLIALSLFGCKGLNNDKTDNASDVSVYVTPTTEKYKLNEKVSQFDNIVKISMAKNEYESAQIIINPKKNVSELDVVLSDFYCGSSKLDKSNIDVFLEHYVYISKNDIKNSEKTGFTEGFYPDAIVPIELRKKALENKVAKGENQGIWLTVKPINNLAAGKYIGKVTIKLDGKETIVPMEIELFDFTLPTENHFKTAFAIWDGMPDDMLFDAYQDSDSKIAENYYEFMLKYRVSPTHIPNVGSVSLEKQKIDFIKNLKREEVGSLCLPYTVTNSQIGFDVAHMTSLLEAVAVEAVANPALIHKVYSYFTYVDEPIPSTYPRVKIVCEAFNNALIDVANRKLSAGGLEKVKEDFLAIQCVTTTHYTQDKISAGLVNSATNVGIDTWCPTFDYYNSEQYRSDMAERKTAGDGSWWYGCVEPRNPYPTMSVNDYFLPMRAVSWMQMEYDIQGQLFWSTNAYGQYSYADYDYVYRDVWKDAVAFPSAPGDGYLTYPGFKYGLKSPIPTMRLDNFRQGQEDYEYLHLLKELFDKNKPQEMNYDFNTYVSNLYKQLYQGTIADLNTHNFINVRYELAKLVESATKGVWIDVGVNAINNKCDVNVYGKDITEVKINNAESVGVSSSNGFTKYAGNFFVDKDNLYANVEYKKDANVYTVSRYTGGKNTIYNKFDSAEALTGVNVSKADAYSDDDIVVTIDSSQVVSGKSMKVAYHKTDKTSYLPTITLNNTEKVDLSQSSRFAFSVYNQGKNDLVLTIIATDINNNRETLYKTFAKKNVWTHTNIHTMNADIKLLKLDEITSIKISINRIKTSDDECNLYFDNMIFAVNN